jgi:NAD(P)-dependent dehydrogenase (short-subunit alcohol dehydrogenase family)
MSNINENPLVIVVGFTGLIGSHVTPRLEASGYEVLGVTHETEPGLDLRDPDSVRSFFEGVEADHVVVAAGDAHFGDFETLDEAAFEVGLQSKLMGQVRVALAALRSLPATGSITLTSGELSHAPIPGSSAVAMVNGAIDSFVRAITLDLPEGPRLNVVSPGWIRETKIRMGLDPVGAVSADDIARLYLLAINGSWRGRVVTADDLEANQ